MDKIVLMNRKLNELSKVRDELNCIPNSLRHIIEFQSQFRAKIPLRETLTNRVTKTKVDEFRGLFNSGFIEIVHAISTVGEKVKNNPELQFAFITDLEILNLKSTDDLKESLIKNLPDEEIKVKEEILNENLLPYLEKLELDSIWLGANYALSSESNPDKLRHCLISIRTILECLIDQKLAPVNELKNSEMFEKEFRNFHSGKESIEHVKIKRAKKIEYFTSKIEFGMLEEFTKKDIDYVCNCYSILCNIHSPNIGITENQVRSLKVKTGITIWLLAYLYDIINN